MKKFFLLLTACCILGSAIAQQKQQGVVFNNDYMTQHFITKDKLPQKFGRSSGTANKTTSSTERWIAYADLFDTLAVIEGYETLLYYTYIWKDSIPLINFSNGLSHVNMLSIAQVLDPSYFPLNDYYKGFGGEMYITPSNVLTFDSVAVVGIYGFNPAKTSVVDTLRIVPLVGTGGPSTGNDIFSGFQLAGGGHYDTASFLDIRYDSVLNTARSASVSVGTPTPGTLTIPLTSADWGDTNANGVWTRAFALSSPLTVPAGGVLGASISFFSGDPTFPTALPGDTVFNTQTNEFKYNMFIPFTRARYNGNSADWAPYDVADRTVGLFKRQPTWANGWSNVYIPTWAWSTGNGSSASSLQFPEIYFHVTCSSCTEINQQTGVNDVIAAGSVNAYPNPASDQLTINYSLQKNVEVNVSLNNVLGQPVASKKMGHDTNGKVVFNVSGLANGVYFYTIDAAGQRITKRVVIAH